MNRGFSYSQHSPRRGRRTLALVTVLVLVLLAVDITTGGSIRLAARDTGAGFQNTLVRMWEALFNSSYFSSRASLDLQVNALEAQLAGFREKAEAYDALKAENDSLASLVHLAQEEKGVAAPIISSLRASPYGTFEIGAGSADGVAVGNLVLTPTGAVVGTVVQAGVHTSLVKEVMAGGSSFDVTISGATVTAAGLGGSNASADVPRGTDVHEGDAVIAPQYHARTVGIVGHVIADPASARTAVSFALPENLASLRYVYVTP